MAVQQVLAGVAEVAVLGGLGVVLHGWLSAPAKSPKPKIQQIAVLRQQPPPPPPKPEEKPPEPELKKEEVKLPDPEPEPQDAKNEPPPAQDLGVDAQGAAGSDGFGLQGRPGGRDITEIGAVGNGRGGGNLFGFFTSLIQSHVQEELSRRDRLRSADYRATVSVWFAQDGRISRAEIVNGTGNPEIDTEIRSALVAASALQPPPPGLPQPVKLRVTSRGAG